jgi:hypothetical protein
MRKTTKLRKLLERDEVLMLPGSYDALGARILQAAGFDAGASLDALQHLAQVSPNTSGLSEYLSSHSCFVRLSCVYLLLLIKIFLNLF